MRPRPISYGMKVVADLHIHSPYSRAVSKEMTFENLDLWARRKGITVMGTGDFTHPAWMREIKEKLEPAEDGLFRIKDKPVLDRVGTRSGNPNFKDDETTRFLLTVEISSIYSKGGKTRRIHNLIFVPSIASAEKINTALGLRGNIKSDGRPILGLDAKELAKIMFDIDEEAMVVPAHCWTPWFSVFGSMSGFDSLEECFDEYARHIYAVETGLSSDPEMNWRVSMLDRIALISNSDSHSLRRIGREANVFECERSYRGIMGAIKSLNPKKFLYTIEFYPEEGKYHYDGHRVCEFSCAPEETKRLNKLCPKCGKGVTVGVMNRVAVLADRPLGSRHAGSIPFKRMVSLDEIIGEAFGLGVASKKVQSMTGSLTSAIGCELGALIDADMADLAAASTPEIAEGIRRVRAGELFIMPGYDGEYGKVRIFKDEERIVGWKQRGLF